MSDNPAPTPADTSAADEIAAQTLQARVKRILDLVDYDRLISHRKHPSRGQFVLTGPSRGGQIERRLGFCVQVRKGCGQFGSDMVFLRHPDGGLIVHENQCFFDLTVEQLELAMPLLEEHLKEEDFDHGYSCYSGVFEKGFLIENSASRSNAPGGLVTMTTTDADGKKTVTTFV